MPPDPLVKHATHACVCFAHNEPMYIFPNPLTAWQSQIFRQTKPKLLLMPLLWLHMFRYIATNKCFGCHSYNFTLKPSVHIYNLQLTVIATCMVIS